MEALQPVRELIANGRFGDALKTLDDVRVPPSQRETADTLRAELLERVGNHGQSLALAERILKSKGVSPSNRSGCEYVIGRIKWESGDTQEAITHLQRSLSIAKQCGDIERMCWSQLRLLIALADLNGPEAMGPMLAELRANTIKLGDARVSAAVHVFVGELEAKRGLFESSIRHTKLAERLLANYPNLWLESVATNTQFAAALLQCDFDAALRHGQHSLRLSERSFRADGRRACLGNLGNLYYLTGRFEDAVDYFERAIAALPSSGEFCNAARETLARIHLVQGRTDECRRVLDQIDESIRTPKDRMLYAHRYALLSRSELLAHEGNLQEASMTADAVLSIANDAGDCLLQTLGAVCKAEVLRQLRSTKSALQILSNISSNLLQRPLDVYAQYEQGLACSLAQAGELESGRAHFERSRRIYEGLHTVPGSIELSRSWLLAGGKESVVDDFDGKIAPNPRTSLQQVLQSTAAVMLLARRGELLCRETVHLLDQTACVRWAAAISRTTDGATELLAACGDPLPTTPPLDAPKRIPIGIARDRHVELLLDPKPDIESMATLNAVMLLLATVHDLERARAEREERLTLWPIEDVPTEGGQAVVSGQMRELMTFARRIATTNVSVLVTGESGTGKEILARAIHGFSARTQKPFVPFNCTAVPREMLESQLFGHRRGSFTGADRDHPGLIRAARDGTLFLDEIGELGLDLQPKLLRFLESGEIAPLGEAPLTVDVRIIAATNSDLELLVRENRFREDLFYRLNVVRLKIPPLRERRDEIPGLVNYFLGRAAAEFRKGQVRLAEETMEHLLFYRWPGNIRQLQNEIRRMVALADKDTVLMPSTLSDDIARARRPVEQHCDGSEVVVPLHQKLLPAISRIEREMIKAALREHRGRVEAAARALGISRKGLYLKRQRLGL
jgi:DNA-binding NtrC family response regulator/tetratricopeptide (TPR) repeat protein